jgi:hypothetical protein
MVHMALPFWTLPDHKISGEGALDPLGVATVSDRLAGSRNRSSTRDHTSTGQ